MKLLNLQDFVVIGVFAVVFIWGANKLLKMAGMTAYTA
jgi:hypothetical protein